MIVGPSNTFNLLDWLYSDHEVSTILSFESTFRTWIRVEISLAETQFDLGRINLECMSAIRELQNMPLPEPDEFLAATRNVGYPIFELVALMNQRLPIEHRGVLHLGATTQDIMDSALAIQIKAVGEILLRKVTIVGDGLAKLVEEHDRTVMPGRTHAQHATPTTFGLKCAVYLAEVSRHARRLKFALDGCAKVSLFGAAGTSAALGVNAAEIRRSLARKLDLQDAPVPWHVSRDSILEFVFSCSMICTTLVRLAREIVELSRTEIAEVSEAEGWHRGASSTMPQKRNPITSEAVIGMGLFTVGMASIMSRAAESQHERAAGEWQLEWKVLPEVMSAAASTLSLASALVHQIYIDSNRMLANLSADQGLILAEAYMIELAKTLGREHSHDLVYEASGNARSLEISLHDALFRLYPDIALLVTPWPLTVADYIGNASEICDEQISEWKVIVKGLR